MTPDSPNPSHEELEARLTALLLGELPDDEAASLREAISKNPELAQIHHRLEQAIELVRATASDKPEPLSAADAPKLSPARREKLLASFKTIRPTELAWHRKVKWQECAALAAMIVVLLIAAALFKSRSERGSVIAYSKFGEGDERTYRWGGGRANENGLAGEKPALLSPDTGIDRAGAIVLDSLEAEKKTDSKAPIDATFSVPTTPKAPPIPPVPAPTPELANDSYLAGPFVKSHRSYAIALPDSGVGVAGGYGTRSDSNPDPAPANRGLVMKGSEERFKTESGALGVLSDNLAIVPLVGGPAMRQPSDKNGRVLNFEAKQPQSALLGERSNSDSPNGGPAQRDTNLGYKEEMGSVPLPVAASPISPSAPPASTPLLTGNFKATLWGLGAPQAGLGTDPNKDTGRESTKEAKPATVRGAAESPAPLVSEDVGGLRMLYAGAGGLSASAAAGSNLTSSSSPLPHGVADDFANGPFTNVIPRTQVGSGFWMNGQASGLPVTVEFGRNGLNAWRVGDMVQLDDKSGLAQRLYKAPEQNTELAGQNIEAFAVQGVAPNDFAKVAKSESVNAPQPTPSSMRRNGLGNVPAKVVADADSLGDLAAGKVVASIEGGKPADRGRAGAELSAKGLVEDAVARNGRILAENDEKKIKLGKESVSGTEPAKSEIALPQLARDEIEEKTQVATGPVVMFETHDNPPRELPKARAAEAGIVGTNAMVATVTLNSSGSARPVDIPADSVELTGLAEIRDRLVQRALQEKVDSAMSKSGPIEILDRAEAAPPKNPTLWERIRGTVTSDVHRSARISVQKETTDTPGIDGQRVSSFDPYWFSTESEKIQSKDVLGKVVEKLNLNETWAGKHGAGSKLQTEDSVRLLKKMIDVRADPKSSLMDISVKSDSADEAARIANTVAEVYRDRRQERASQMALAGRQVLEEETARIEKQIAQAREQSALQKSKLNVEQTDVSPPKLAAGAPTPQPEIATANNPFSTFSLNVSDVSFKLAAASLEKGQMPDPATVRSEEFINAFDYHDPEPAGSAPVAFAWERTRYPFAHDREMLRFSIKTAASGRQPGRPLNLVILLDNSGSMERADRVRIRRECLRVLASQLHAPDRISVVAFARTARLVVDGVAGSNAGNLAEWAGSLTPEGGTNLEDAMNLAYQTALRHFLANGINRVVLLTDGAANLGDVKPDSLKKKVEAHRKQGIALDCFGIGWEGYNDDLLEGLSRNGDGRYGFVNTPEAVTAEFAGQLAGALHVAASDVKVQVEWNPRRVTAYRQIGYAKHQLKKEQFRDNTVDAAEIGAAEAGNALYLAQVNPAGEGPLATVRVRFKVPGTTDVREHEWIVPFQGTAKTLEQSSPALRLATTASAFSEWLVSSPFAAEVTPDRLLGYLNGVPEVWPADPRPKQFESMIRQAKSVAGK